MFSWNVISSNPWSIDDTEVYEGSYSSVSADIGNNSSSTMEIDVDVLYDGTLSFMKKVSSEDNQICSLSQSVTTYHKPELETRFLGF